MSLRRLMLSAALVSAPLFLGGASTLAAQSRQLFTWTGRVDREIQLAMRGRDVWTRQSDRDDEDRSRTRVESALPRYGGYVRVETRDGRGDVAVIQQPTARNDYTTIIRVRDRSGGSDRYRIVAYWESASRDDRGGWQRPGNSDGGWGTGRSGDGSWPRGDDDSARRQPRVEPRDRSNDDSGGWNGGSRTALRWSGAVDDEVEIRLQGRRADYRSLSGAGTRQVRSDVVGEGLPRRDVRLSVEQRQGRGTVYIVQQPSALNGYTAVVRVRDSQGGFGYYDFDLVWR